MITITFTNLGRALQNGVMAIFHLAYHIRTGAHHFSCIHSSSAGDFAKGVIAIAASDGGPSRDSSSLIHSYQILGRIYIGWSKKSNLGSGNISGLKIN